METETEIGCGQNGHDPDCLCDVDMSKATDTWVFDGVHGMSFGYEIAQYRGYGRPWDGRQLADYLTDLGRFHDEWMAQKPVMELEMIEAQGLSDDSSLVSMDTVRRAVKARMDSDENPDIVVVLGDYGLSAMAFLKALTTNKIPADKLAQWTIERLAQFQEELVSVNAKPKLLQEKYGLTEAVFWNLRKYFHGRFRALGVPTSYLKSPSREAARAMAKEMSLNPEVTNSEIIRAVFQKHGYKYSHTALSKMRSRLHRTHDGDDK